MVSLQCQDRSRGEHGALPPCRVCLLMTMPKPHTSPDRQVSLRLPKILHKMSQAQFIHLIHRLEQPLGIKGLDRKKLKYNFMQLGYEIM